VRAAAVAAELAADRAVMAVIGPTSDESAPAAEVYTGAGVPLIALSVGSFEAREDYDTLLHARPNTGFAGLAIPSYLTHTLRAERVGLVDDRSADAYSWQTTRAVSGTIDRDRIELVPRVLPAGTWDFGSVAAQFVDEDVDAVVYCGFARGAGRLALALREAGWTGVGLATQEALSPVFFEEAGAAAEGWRFVATYTDPAADESALGFATVHRQRFGTPAEPYAVEGYDATRMLAEEMGGMMRDGGRVTRAGLLTRMRGARYRGVARELAFDPAGEYAGTGPMAYLYEATARDFRFRGPAPFPGT
jgi:eukaryotic-like serine/threonine-protein kinase